MGSTPSHLTLQQVERRSLHVGLCGAGIGGVAAAIALQRAGAQVTVLESAKELGEIGAGIQMTPNVSRFLIRWGAAEVIGDNLVEFEDMSLRNKDGTRVGYVKMMPNAKDNFGYPWWVVHRAHLHAGLVEVAQRIGVKLIIDSRVIKIDYQKSPKVTVSTESGAIHEFDLLIGSDGVSSIVRSTLFPDIKPTPPTANCAYRAIVPKSQILQDPIAKELVARSTMDVWMDSNSYIITYPISGGRDFNLVLAHHVPGGRKLEAVEEGNIEEMRRIFGNHDERIKRVVWMINETKRWPLLVTEIDSWSSPNKNVVLMGDAAHSMTNHMAQGAATAMEDGAFLGRCISRFIQGQLSLQDVIGIYEKERMPRAAYKQQISFLNGAIWQIPNGSVQQARDTEMHPELQNTMLDRSPNLHADLATYQGIYAYDAEAHAEESLSAFAAGIRGREWSRRELKRRVYNDKVDWWSGKFGENEGGYGLRHASKL